MKRLLATLLILAAPNWALCNDSAIHFLDITKDCGDGLVTNAGFVRGESNQIYVRTDDGRITQCELSGAHAKVTATFSQEGHSMFMPAWSPDGRSIAYMHQGDVYLYNVESRTSSRVTATRDVVGTKLVWKNNQEMFFTTSSSRGGEIRVVNVKNKTSSTLVVGQGYYGVLGFIGKTGHVYFSYSSRGASPRFSLFVGDLAESSITGQRKVTDEEIVTEMVASVTADEKVLVVAGRPSFESKGSDVYVINPLNGATTRIEHEEGWSDDFAEISRDGKHIVVVSRRSGPDVKIDHIQKQHVRYAVFWINK